MKGNLSTVILAAGVMAVATASAHAESSGFGSNQTNTDKFQWREVAGEFSPSEYRTTYRHNMRVIRSTVVSYSKDAMKSMGMPESARKLVGGAAGAAASLLTNRDLKFRLNDKKTFALEVQDPIDNNRALFLNYKLKW